MQHTVRIHGAVAVQYEAHISLNLLTATHRRKEDVKSARAQRFLVVLISHSTSSCGALGSWVAFITFYCQ